MKEHSRKTQGKKHGVLYTYTFSPPCRQVVDGGRISLSTGREEVSLTLESTTVNDTGYWNCTAQVYDGDNVVGQSVEGHIRLVVVGEFT